MVVTEKEQDIVVLGAGMAGLVAAIEGTAGNARVSVIDKLSRDVIWEKSTAVSAGGNETGRAAGGGLARFTDTEPIEEAMSRHIEKNLGKVDPEIIRTYLERIAGDCKWLRDDLGLPYEDRGIFGLGVEGRGTGLATFLYNIAQKKGIQVFFDTKAIRLLMDESGKIIGVRAKTADQTIDFKAKAVILATGGFEGNQEMMLKYAGPEITYGTILTGCPVNTGDGHMMALEARAQLINLSVCHIRTTDQFMGIGPARAMRNIYHRGIFVNKNCQRFLDEGDADSDTIGNAVTYQPEHVAALIFDENARSAYPEEFEKYPRKDEVIKQGQTIEELALKIDLPPQALKRLIDEFNGAVNDGKAMKLAIPKTNRAFRIDTPPFYGFYPILPGNNHTLGGLKINPDAQVLDRENKPIKGLYAAGSIVNWSFGMPYYVENVRTFKGSYHAGNSSGLATALAFGRIAGKNAAEAAITS
ncbi:FAD-binding protein [Chloroflexota bacterium]